MVVSQFYNIIRYKIINIREKWLYDKNNNKWKNT